MPTPLLFLLLAAQAGPPVAADPGRAAYADDGRIVVEIGGDLWLASEPGDPSRLVRLTAGPALDLEPAWTPDGGAVVFASDRAGGFDLWRVAVGGGGAAGEPVRLTSTPEPEREPAPALDGSIVFVRGRRADADLWILETDGAERRVTEREGAERMPAVSPDGESLAYIADADGRRELRVRRLDGEGDRAAAADHAAEYPAWSRDGERLAFTTRRGRIGVWVVPADGGYPNLVSRRQARPVWSPDGRRLLLTGLPPEAPGYNGDPDRIAERGVADAPPDELRLWLVDAPPPVDASLAEVGLATPATPDDRVAAFDRVWERLARLYYDGPADAARRAQWEALRDELRPRVRAARDHTELDEVVQELLRRRPTYRDEAVGRAAVSSAHPLATEAGLEILRKGGNVVDAAVAVSFALGVVEPDASGVGGYGQMLIRLDTMDEPALIEFMTRAPQAATLENGSLDGASGPALANVPGTVDGMWRAWRIFGSGELAWAELLEPAIRLAEQGFVLDDAFPTTLARERDRFLRYESSRALFFRDGRPLQPGDTLRNPDLAWTLRQIAEGGADAFYRGEIARRMVEDLRGKGNAMTLQDMARYYAEWRRPIRGTYRGHTIYSSAPPVSGGATLVAQLNLLEHLARPEPPTEDAATAHAMIEAWKLVPSSRGRIADPGLWPVDAEPFLDKDTADARWRCFSPDTAIDPQAIDRAGCAGATTRTALGDDDAPDCESGAPEYPVQGCRATGTTAFAIADADGNIVSVTQTLGTWGGNFYVTPGLGFIYNDKLNSYGRDPDGYGARLPNARHGSTIAPTLVFRGTGNGMRPLLAAGAAGNAWITAAVYQIVTGVIDQGYGPQRAIEQPRFLPTRQPAPNGGSETVVQYEEGFAPAVIRRLREIGHRLQPISTRGELRMGYGAAVMIDGGRVRAGGDPRRSGAGGAVP